MSQLSKQVQKVVQATNGRNTKQVIDDLMQMLCNLISEQYMLQIQFPHSAFNMSDEFRLELSYYKKFPQAWTELQTLAEMFMAEIAQAEPFTDLIGMLYQDQLRGNKLAQFLTPQKLAYGLGKLFMQSTGPINEPVIVGDPTGCGSGALILGQLKATLELYGKDSIKNMDVLAVDIDINMVKMTTVQVILHCLFHNIPVRSFCSNRANMITEYEAFHQGKQVVCLWIPEYKSKEQTNIEKSFNLAMELEQEMVNTVKTNTTEKETYDLTI